MCDYYDEYSVLNEIIQERKEKSKPSVERLNTPQEKKYNEFVKQIYNSSKKVKKNKK